MKFFFLYILAMAFNCISLFGQTKNNYIITKNKDTIWCEITSLHFNMFVDHPYLNYILYNANGISGKINRKHILSYYKDSLRNGECKTKKEDKKEFERKRLDLLGSNYIVKYDSSLSGLPMESGSTTSGGGRYTTTDINGRFVEKGKGISRSDFIYFENGKFCNARNHKLLTSVFDQVPKAKRIYNRYMFFMRINTYGAFTWLGTMAAGLNVDPDFQLHSKSPDHLAPLKISLLVVSGICLIGSEVPNP